MHLLLLAISARTWLQPIKPSPETYWYFFLNMKSIFESQSFSKVTTTIPGSTTRRTRGAATGSRRPSAGTSTSRCPRRRGTETASGSPSRYSSSSTQLDSQYSQPLRYRVTHPNRKNLLVTQISAMLPGQQVTKVAAHHLTELPEPSQWEV